MHVWAIAFGCVIGWGSFINPGKKFLSNSGVAGTAIAMVLGALVMIILAFSYAYMVPKYPKAGGEFTFTKMCFGKNLAFVCGWFLVVAYLTNVPMNSTAIGLIVDGLDGQADILKFGFHYSIAGFDIYLGEMLLAMSILILFGYLNIIGVQKAAIVQTILSTLLVTCVFTLFVAALVSSKAKGVNMEPIWGFDKKAAIEAGATTATLTPFVHRGTAGVLSAILATFAIAPWAYVGFDAIPQAAEEFNFSFKKVSFIMIIAIVFGCFVYTSNNTVAAAALENWPDRVMAGEWVVLVAAEELLGVFGKVLVGLGVSCAVLSDNAKDVALLHFEIYIFESINIVGTAFGAAIVGLANLKERVFLVHNTGYPPAAQVVADGASADGTKTVQLTDVFESNYGLHYIV